MEPSISSMKEVESKGEEHLRANYEEVKPKDGT